jgi:hypothetical protein
MMRDGRAPLVGAHKGRPNLTIERNQCVKPRAPGEPYHNGELVGAAVGADPRRKRLELGGVPDVVKALGGDGHPRCQHRMAEAPPGLGEAVGHAAAERRVHLPLTREQALARPTPEDWNILEVLGHITDFHQRYGI